MSKLYTNKKTAASILSGKLTEISEDRKTFTVAYQEYNNASKKFEDKTQVCTTMMALDDSYSVKQNVTVIGAKGFGGGFNVESVSNKESAFEYPDLAVVSGHVQKAFLNEEKDQDGNPKMKQDGTPRKPHYDIHISVPEGDRVVNHIIKVYDSPKYQKEGELSQTEKVAKRFASFENPETTPMRVTIATQPGQEFSFEKSGDTPGVYYGCSHLGFKSIDLEYEFSKSKNMSTPLTKEPEKEAPTKADSTEATVEPTNVPVEAPVTSVETTDTIETVDGFDSELEFE